MILDLLKVLSMMIMQKFNYSDHIDGGAALLDAMTVRQKWAAEIGQQLKNEE